MTKEIGYIEELFLKANEEIDMKNYNEAKAILEEILEIEPTYGRAYNHLAWIYSDVLKIMEKAEPLYKLAIQYAPSYGAPYVNYLYLLLDKYEVETAKKIMELAWNVPEVDKGTLNYINARFLELNGEYKQAYKSYKKARGYALNSGFLNHTNSELDRVRVKIGKWRSAWAIMFW